MRDEFGHTEVNMRSSRSPITHHSSQGFTGGRHER